MDEPTDERLLDAYLRSGDASQFDVLAKRHIGKVRAMIFGMVLNDEDADDLTQEVFLRSMRGLPSFGRRACFRTWLYRITMNTTYSFLRRKRRNPVEIRERVPDLSVEPEALPHAGMLSRERDDRVTTALCALPPTLRAAITLTAIQGMSPRDAAEAEGCLAATLYWRLHRARKLLKAALAEKEWA